MEHDTPLSTKDDPMTEDLGRDVPRPRRVVPAKYPEQLIMMTTAEMARDVAELADQDGLSVSAELRALVEDGLATRRTQQRLAAQHGS